MTRAGILTAVAEGIVASPLRELALHRTTRRLREAHGASRAASVAFYLGEGLARRNETLVGRLRTGSPIVLDMREYAHRHVYFHGTYEEPTTRLLHRLAQPGWTVVDVGANNGYFTLLSADLGGAGAQVHAFEPNPAVARLLGAGVRLSGWRGIAVREAACGDASFEAPLYLSADPRNSGLSTLEAALATGRAQLTVPVVRLDDYCREEGIEPDLVKVDAEGYEDRVIRGMGGLLERGVPRILICELARDARRPDPAGIVEELSAAGYTAHRIGADGGLLPLAAFDFENICFVSGLRDA
ncbi:MAG: FkbM family methyltransferase [Actinomycetota bacterium]|nr:FkbM family methyltransferase [Actinomycetota bacterium]